MDLKEREARPITQTEAEKVKVSGAYLTSWSFDGGKLLFYVAPALPDDASQHQLIMEMINPALSNWRVYDLTTGKTEMLSLPARFVAWLPDGDFLLIPNGEKAWQPILRWRPGSASPSEFVTEKADYGQFSLSSDGKAILGLAAFDDRTFSIVSIDTQTGSLQRVIGPGKFAQYNRPAASPRAKRLAYLERRGKETTLVSNGIAMPLALVGWPSFHWINDQTIAALDKCKLAILDVKSRRVIAQHPVKLHANEDRDKVCQP